MSEHNSAPLADSETAPKVIKCVKGWNRSDTEACQCVWWPNCWTRLLGYGKIQHLLLGFLTRIVRPICDEEKSIFRFKEKTNFTYVKTCHFRSRATVILTTTWAYRWSEGGRAIQGTMLRCRGCTKNHLEIVEISGTSEGAVNNRPVLGLSTWAISLNTIEDHASSLRIRIALFAACSDKTNRWNNRLSQNSSSEQLRNRSSWKCCFHWGSSRAIDCWINWSSILWRPNLCLSSGRDQSS